ncbi:hypothetical protein [Cupriavidus metallidurans]|nr:hypothetical protein [Cupriavidus metallidurans]
MSLDTAPALRAIESLEVPPYADKMRREYRRRFGTDPAQVVMPLVF